MPERLRIGSVEIAVARDADYRFAPAAELRDAAGNAIPRAAWRPYLGDRDPDALEDSRVLTFVLRSRGKTILVDTGVGPWGLWRFGEGHLLESLAALDVSPDEIDVVLPTHLHLDHVGWNTRPSPHGPVPTFPRARYIFQQADWDFFTAEDALRREDNRAKMMRLAVLPLKESGLLQLVGAEARVAEEVTLLHTPGHTPGSVSVLVQSGGEAALLIGDVAHHAVELSEPDWSPLFDVDRTLAARSRQALVEQAVRLQAYVAAAHFADADPTFGRILEFAGRRVWRGVQLT